MARSLFFKVSEPVFTYASNEPVYLKKTVVYGCDDYVWNTGFISLLNAFFSGDSVPRMSDLTDEQVKKFVSFADGLVPETDEDFNLYTQFNNFLATVKQPQVTE